MSKEVVPLRKLKKILFITAICLVFAFTLQKSTNYYIERKINSHLVPYRISARLEKLSNLTLEYKGFSLTCKIKLEDGNLALYPIKNGMAVKLLPDKLKIALN